MVHLSEGAIEQGFRMKVEPAALASQLLAGGPARGGKPGRAGRISGRAVTVASVVGCATAPIEAYLFDEPASELPPLDHCPAPPQNKGLAAGIANMSFIDLKTQEKIWKGLLGRVVTRAELLSVYTGVTRSGAKVTTKIRSVRGSERDMSLHIAFDLDVDGYSGYMSRVFRPVRLGGETRCQVYHDQFDLDSSAPKTTGQGIGEYVTRNSLEWYRKLGGVAETRLMAAWVGRYVWATFGWQWDRDEGEQKALEMYSYVAGRRHKGDWLAIGRTLAGDIDFDEAGGDEQFSRLRPDAVKSIFVRMASRAWNFASLELQNARTGEMDRVGRVFLCGMQDPRDPKRYVQGEEGAATWEGSLVIDERHPTWQRAKARLGLR